MLGSNEIVTPNEFLSHLENLHKVDIKKLKAGDTSEMEHLASMMDLLNGGASEDELFG